MSISSPWVAHVLTLFPQMFPGPLGFSLVGKALDKGLWQLQTTDIRAFAEGRHQSVDDTPYGGGAGMVMRPDVIARAVDHVQSELSSVSSTLVYLTPRGRPLMQKDVEHLIRSPHVIFLCGRYEGVDERVLEAYPWQHMSLGDFIVSGGETALFPLLDACVRLLPGVLGKEASLADESFTHGLLEYPHYTRPAMWRDQSVPPVLLSGHHGHIRSWRHHQSQTLTQKLRPDLWKLVLEKASQKG